MYTQCPDCSSVFEISPEHLAAAGGMVQCGVCNTTFNALRRLTETPPEPAETEPASSSAPEESTVDTKTDENAEPISYTANDQDGTNDEAIESRPIDDEATLAADEFSLGDDDVAEEVTSDRVDAGGVEDGSTNQHAEEQSASNAEEAEPDSETSGEDSTFRSEAALDDTGITERSELHDDPSASSSDSEGLFFTEAELLDLLDSEEATPSRDESDVDAAEEELNEILDELDEDDDQEAVNPDDLFSTSQVLDEWDIEEGENVLEAILADDSLLEQDSADKEPENKQTDTATDTDSVNAEPNASDAESEPAPDLEHEPEPELEDAATWEVDESDLIEDEDLEELEEFEQFDDLADPNDFDDFIETDDEIQDDQASIDVNQEDENYDDDGASTDSDAEQTNNDSGEDREAAYSRNVDEADDDSLENIEDANDSALENEEETDSRDKDVQDTSEDRDTELDPTHDDTEQITGDNEDEDAEAHLSSESAEDQEPVAEQDDDADDDQSDDPDSDSNAILTEGVDGKFEDDYGDAEDLKDLGNYLAPKKSWARQLTEGSIAVVLAGLLAGQYVHHNRAELATHPQFGAHVRNIYSLLGKDLHVGWKVSDYRVARHTIVPNEDDANILLARATVVNNAEFERPLPLIRLQLKNRWGDSIYGRVFTPDEYFEGTAPGTLAGNAKLEVSLDLVHPAPDEEIGYSFDVCLDTPNGPDCGTPQVFTK